MEERAGGGGGVRDYEMGPVEAASGPSPGADGGGGPSGGFAVSPLVSAHLGVDARREREREERIEADVASRVAGLADEAFERGLAEGREAGKREVYERTREASEEKIERLTEVVSAVMGEKEALLRREKVEVCRLVRDLVKWIVLRELEGDGEYVMRLLEKLVKEVGAGQRLLVQVGREQFDRMPEMLELVRGAVGGLGNVRIEVDYDIEGKGVVIESENSVLSGVLEDQFAALDRLFETVGVPRGPAAPA